MEASRLRDVLRDPRLLAVPIFLYGSARAAFLSITHDEALTYLFHVRAPWSVVFSFSAPLPSNNHLLNTMAVKALLSWLPPTELVLRLPALAGLALYLWAAQRIIRSSTTGARRPLGFLLLAANPFVLDLLTVSRGYALALGLSLGAFSLLLGVPPRRGGARWAGAAFLAALAVVANLAFLYVLAALAAVALWSAMALGDRAGGTARLRAALAAVGPFVVAGALLRLVYTAEVVGRIQRVVASWGGERGVWRDTVASLADGTLNGATWFSAGHQAWTGALTVAAGLVLAASAALALTLRRDPSCGNVRGRVLTASVVAIAGWMLQAIVARDLTGARFPIERAASFLVPLLTLAFVLLWETAAARGWRATSTGCGALTVAALAHFAACANLSHTHLWHLDADMRAAMRTVARAAAAAPPGALRLAVSWQLEPAANFYRVTRGLTGLAPVTRADPRSGFDLCLLAGDDAALLQSLGLRPCVTFTVSGTVLAAAPGLPCPATR